MMCLLSRLLFLFVLLSGVLQLSVGQSADNQQCASNEQVEEIVDQGTRKLEGKQEDLYELLVKKIKRTVSSTFGDCSTTLHDHIEGLVKNHSEILYNRVMEKMQNLHTTTLEELRSQIQNSCSGHTQGPTEQSHQSTPTTAPSYTTEVAATTGPKVKDSELSDLQTVSLKGTYEHPVNSCKDIPEDSRSGEYWIVNNCNKTPTKVYCDMTRSCCNDTGGWTRVANLDMTNSSHQCPDSFKLLNYTTAPRRLCSRDGIAGCKSTKFDTHAINYSRVCGRIIGYQYGDPYAFYYNTRYSIKINNIYVDGVSLTHGNSQSRKHIWTFAAGADETSASSLVCPCTRTDLTYQGSVPSYVGQDYFCDTANHDASYKPNVAFYGDPLWDGDGCVSTSSCCCFNTPPWFCKQLTEPTTDDIELRLCNYNSAQSGTPLEIVELYIK